MAVNLSPVGGVAAQFFTNTGAVLTGGKLYTYLSGTTTPATTYTTSAGNVAWSNPIVLNSAGRVSGSGEIWLTSNIVYKFVLKDSNDVLIGSYDNVSSNINTEASRVTYTPVGVGAEITTVQAKLQQYVSVQDFGALGDGSGATPNDTGDDISIASWNTWDNTPWKDDPAYSPWYANVSATFQPPRAKPFANDDTWDFIGCNLALWQSYRQEQKTYFPAGTYVMNAYSTIPKGGYQGLFVMKGMEQVICGAGPYETLIVWKENAAFFQSNNYGVENYYKLLSCYRIGGPPTNIMEMAFVGPTNYDSESKNITGIYCANINGVTFRDLWLTSCEYGIYAYDNSGDSHISRTTAEYCFGAFLYTDATSEISVDFCNFWSSTTNVLRQRGVWGLGRISVTNSRSIDFRGGGIEGASGIVSNNYVTTSLSNGNSITLTGSGLVSNNQIIGSPAGASIAVVENVSIIGNYIYNTSNHNCINLGNGAASSAHHIVIDGNTFIKTNSASEAQNYAIIAPVNNVGYTGAATNTVIISNNTFQGRALPIVGEATMINNTFDDAIVSGNVNSRGDVSGSLVTTASGGASFTFNVTGLIGQTQGAVRDTKRVTIINVYSNCSGHEVHGVAIYTNNFLGYAQLLGTLGKYESGGTITFGQSTVYPTVTITNTSGLTAGVQVYALPII
jgi:hypothetical protein